MIKIRKSNERGAADHGWLKSQHSFSFADYYDPENMGFGNLRVINEDFIAGGKGFGSHPHRDMEIITYVIAGAVEHKDSMGNTGVILPGEVQYMSAGTGVVHSEFNHFKDQITHLFQIWILPNAHGHTPRYNQKSFAKELLDKALVLVASGDGKDGSIEIHQDAKLYVGKIIPSNNLVHKIAPARKIWLHTMKGSLQVNGAVLQAGDALSAENEKELDIRATEPSEFLLFDLGA